jgi:CheY-like chemotaxis protein
MCKPKSAEIVESNRLTMALAHSRHSPRSYVPCRRSSTSRCRRRRTNVSRHEPAEGAVLTSATVDGSRNDLQSRVLVRHLAGHVLLVDDMREDSLLLASMLTPLDTNVMIAQSTAEALAMLDKQVVDLVVTDLNMPGASGLDLTRELRKRHDVPAVIFLTGSISARDKVEALQLGAVAYLQKPVDLEHLIRLAREILGSRRAE